MAQSWSIIILCYNEEGNLKIVVSDLLKTLDQMQVTNLKLSL